MFKLQEQESYFATMESRLPPVKERKGVSFTELEDFFRLVILKIIKNMLFFLENVLLPAVPPGRLLPGLPALP